MQYRVHRGEKLSEIGLGCHALSGAYGQRDPESFVGLLRRAYELGDSVLFRSRQKLFRGIDRLESSSGSSGSRGSIGTPARQMATNVSWVEVEECSADGKEPA